MSITETLLRPYLRDAAARPLITHYDDALGSRVELSATTLANWAAKTANWLTDEFDVEPGMSVGVRLPAHWQTAGILLGCWWCGARVVETGPDLAVTFGTVSEPAPASGELAVVSLDPMGMALREPPAGGAFDYVSEVRVCADDFLAPPPVSPDSPALAELSVAEVLDQARQLASKHALDKESRVLSTLDWTVPDGILRGLVAVLRAGASLVQCSSADPAKLSDRAASERSTVQFS
ncbi:uncharacterized protein (TIGR03089 family) [Tamaricihabitans halophyticus]|uniref:Uncharacterized protein (TIGR03089 family) n=1 Tax=Tamaricihabitans halophyticus TaxID=1262583 RepID=A0A4R2R0T8_9PSEU|nr:TIGR03089 family protein [Tamaricihabitans halophyticus]TCP56093.1 uncharacterized protein (TIGR03089 family) [Tamaricihabitans halophyticus]